MMQEPIKENKLRGMVFGKYGSISRFAERIGWSTRKANYIVNGKQEPTASDIIQMADALEVRIPANVRDVFFDR